MTGEPKPITNRELEAHGLANKIPAHIIEQVKVAEAMRTGQDQLPDQAAPAAPAAIQPLSASTDTQSELEKMRAISQEKTAFVIKQRQQEAGLLDDQPDPIYAAQQDAKNEGGYIPPWLNANAVEMIKGRRFQLWDGRVIDMGPPAQPVELIIMEMVTDHKTVLEFQTRTSIARVMNYVRAVDGVRTPKALTTWYEVYQLYLSLGELGYKACNECYMQTWPNTGGVYWQDIKKPS